MSATYEDWSPYERSYYRIGLTDYTDSNSFLTPAIAPTSRYFLRSKDSCVFLAYLQYGQSLDTLNIHALQKTLNY